MPLSAEHSRITQQAAEWIVSLTADDAADRASARAGFEAWKQADPRHAAAALRMESMLRKLDAHDGRPARAALSHAGRASRKRSVASKASALAVALLVGALGIGVPLDQPSLLFADMRTGAGEWQTRVLVDGSRITLSGGSAIDVQIDGTQRVITLLQGDVLVDVARDSARPFFVRTEDGSIRALGTRFAVERGRHATDLAMLESKTEVRAAGNPDAATVVVAGERVRITPAGVGPVANVDAGSVDEAWRDHQLVALNRPLAEVLDQLARHHRGIIQYDARQIAGLRVSAVLPLDDTGRSLHLLLNSFPTLRIRMVTPYVVLVDAPAK